MSDSPDLHIVLPETLPPGTIRIVARDGDRWGLHIRPLPSGEAEIQLTAAVEGVAYAEIIHHLVKALTAFTGTPLQRVPTEAQVAAQKRLAQLAVDSPAVRLYVREGKRLCLSSVGVAAVGEPLTGAGWIDAGPMPEGVAAYACDYLRDVDAFNAAHLPPVEPAVSAAPPKNHLSVVPEAPAEGPPDDASPPPG